MRQVDFIIAVIVLVPMVTALLAALVFIIGMVVASVRGGVEGAETEIRHRRSAQHAQDANVERCRDGEDGVPPGTPCGPSAPEVFRP